MLALLIEGSFFFFFNAIIFEFHIFQTAGLSQC